MDKPLRKQVKDGEDDGEMQGKVARDVNGYQGLIQYVSKVRAFKLVVRLGKGVLSDDISCQSHLGAAQTYNGALISGIGGQVGVQLIDLSVDDGLQ